MPKRIQMSRQKPWRADNPHAVMVARPSRWGNPFRVGAATLIKRYPAQISMPTLEASIVPRDRAEAVRLFRYMVSEPQVFHSPSIATRDVMAGYLRGRDLACWCPLDQPCHADVLLELANSTR